MKQDRLAIAAGFMPAAVMALLLLMENMLTQGRLTPTWWLAAVAEAAAYLGPILVLCLLRDDQGQRAGMRLTIFHRRSVWFIVWMSLVSAIVAAMANGGVQVLLRREAYAEWNPAAYGITEKWQVFLLVVLLPAVVEELFFRGVLFSALERSGTWPALLLSSAAFALVHGDLSNLAGPFVAGLIYGYMTYVLDSVWPAVFAHMVHNLGFLFLGYASRTYSVLGIWSYVLLIALFFLCLFLALAMRSLEGLIEKGKIRRLQYQGASATLTGIFVSPGMWLLLILFIIRVLYS